MAKARFSQTDHAETRRALEQERDALVSKRYQIYLQMQDEDDEVKHEYGCGAVGLSPVLMLISGAYWGWWPGLFYGLLIALAFFLLTKLSTSGNHGLRQEEREKLAVRIKEIEKRLQSPVAPLRRSIPATTWTRSTDNYEEYLESFEWKEKARQVRERAGFQCEQCGARGRLEVHHLTYDSLFNEDLDDLVALCRECHQAKHS